MKVPAMLRAVLAIRLEEEGGVRGLARSAKLSASHVSRIKNGHVSPSDKTLRRLGIVRTVIIQYKLRG